MTESQLPVESKSDLITYLERVDAVMKMLRTSVEARLTEPHLCKATFRELATVSRRLVELVRWIKIQLEYRACIEERDAK